MENIGSLDRDTIMSVLSEGKNLAKELKIKLNPSTDSREACDILVANILSSYENAIKLLDVTNVFELPNSILGSPASEGSDLTSKDQSHKSKKRKTLPKWSEQVRVHSETGIEGQIDDGYNWRKYGQKDILGANHPRAYYRCTHRNTQGCLATKQVQRADEDPSFFDVIYRGNHSCLQEKLRRNNEDNLIMFRNNGDEMTSQKMVNEKSLNELIVAKEDDPFASFSFPSTPILSENLETRFFSETSDFNGASFLSPATSESYFSMPHCQVNDVGEIMSNPIPFLDFPLGDLDISIGEIDFSSQSFDGIDYF